MRAESKDSEVLLRRRSRGRGGKTFISATFTFSTGRGGDTDMMPISFDAAISSEGGRCSGSHHGVAFALPKIVLPIGDITLTECDSLAYAARLFLSCITCFSLHRLFLTQDDMRGFVPI